MGVTSKDGSDGSEGSEGKEGGSDRMPLNEFENKILLNQTSDFQHLNNSVCTEHRIYSPLEVFNF